MDKAHWLDEIIPVQRKGNQSTTTSRVRYSLEAFADSQFSLVRQRLLDVNHWHQFAGKNTAHFQLLDSSGAEVWRLAQKGDYFRIDIPGPGPRNGDGNDWVQVQVMGDRSSGSEQLTYMTVRSSPHPLALVSDAAHFLGSDATSTFFIHRKGLILTAGVAGRNEIPNIHSAKPIDRIRNLFVAIGAFFAGSAAQWKSLTYGLLHYHIKAMA